MCPVGRCYTQCGSGSICTGALGPLGKYDCTCMEGYFAPKHDGRNCYRDECSYSNGGCDHTCMLDKNHQVLCSCNEGAKLHDDMKTCLSQNHCNNDNGGCSHKCELDADSNVMCTCHDGFEVDTDQKTCLPINNCLTENGGCDQVCVHSFPGINTCECNAGYIINDDGKTCHADELLAVGGKTVLIVMSAYYQCMFVIPRFMLSYLSLAFDYLLTFYV